MTAMVIPIDRHYTYKQGSTLYPCSLYGV